MCATALVRSDGTRWRSQAVAPLYGIAAAHPFAVLAFAEVGQIFRTGDAHGAGSVARHYRKLSSFRGSRGREIQEAQKHNDWSKFADLLNEDLVAIDEDGFRTKKELLDAIQAADIRFSDYKMEDVRTIPEDNGAIVAYKQTLVGTDHGKPFTWHIFTNSHWERHGDKWLLTVFQDSMAK